MNVIGDVRGRTCVLQDDIIDTAGTIVKAAQALKANGAERIIACAVHGVLSGPAIERIEQSPIEKLVVTNTIPQSEACASSSKIIVPVGGASARRRRFAASTRRPRCPRCSCRELQNSEFQDEFVKIHEKF